jgi:hypothetical protein
MKLAENQTELSKQIVELNKTVEQQGKLMRRLVTILDSYEEGSGSEDGEGSSDKGRRRRGKGKEVRNGSRGR